VGTNVLVNQQLLAVLFLWNNRCVIVTGDGCAMSLQIVLTNQASSDVFDSVLQLPKLLYIGTCAPAPY
jgi:hypothetical protein